MIASYKHGFIFFKTRKTAGSSIEFALGPHCGPQDIVAPIGPSEDRDRASLTGVVPMNIAHDRSYEARYVAALKRGNKKLIRELLVGHRQQGGIVAHEAALTLKPRLAPEFWDRAFKFTVERHPYEKALSLAWFRYRTSGDFMAHLDRVVHTMAEDYRGFHLYSIDNSSVADVVMRHETLQADLDNVSRKLGLPILTLPFRRRHAGRDRRPARDVLTEAQKAFILDVCRQEFELLGWAP